MSAFGGKADMPFCTQIHHQFGQRRCPVCGAPMFMARIEPTDKDGEDRHTFECVSCDYAENTLVKFR
jgi:ssDNA-binding Zn-finger/Zn-ribbon topoisomerase 1